jgi:hypothetical protein
MIRFFRDKLNNRIMTDIIRLNFVPMAFVSELSERNTVTEIM